jgi:ATP-dependent helicase/DNAse subunit B
MTTSKIITIPDVLPVEISAAGLGPWSISKIKLLDKCPWQFFLKYVIKEKVENPPVSIITEVGKAAHLILEHVALGRDVDKSFALAKEEYVDKLGEAEWAEKVLTLEYNIVQFKERLENLSKKHSIKRVLTELKMGVDKDWKPTGFFAKDVYIRGVIDLIIELTNNDVIIIDHKTGAMAISGLRCYEDQLNGYKVLFHHGVQPIAGAQAGIHYIREGDVRLDQYHSRQEIETRLKARFQYAIDCAVDKVIEMGYFKHIAGSACQYCDFKVPCKGKEHLALEKSTKKYFEIKKV